MSLVNLHFRLHMWVPRSEHYTQPSSGEVSGSQRYWGAAACEHWCCLEPPETPQEFVSATHLFNKLHSYSANKELLLHNLLMIWNTWTSEPDLPLLSVGRLELLDAGRNKIYWETITTVF